MGAAIAALRYHGCLGFRIKNRSLNVSPSFVLRQSSFDSTKHARFALHPCITANRRYRNGDPNTYRPNSLPVIRSYAPTYLARVLWTISAGKTGPGGCLFHPKASK